MVLFPLIRNIRLKIAFTSYFHSKQQKNTIGLREHALYEQLSIYFGNYLVDMNKETQYRLSSCWLGGIYWNDRLGTGSF